MNEFPIQSYTEIFGTIKGKLKERDTGLILAYIIRSEGKLKGNYERYKIRQSENLAHRLFSVSEWIKQEDKIRYLDEALRKAKKWFDEKKELPTENHFERNLKTVTEQVFRKMGFSDEALNFIYANAEEAFIRSLANQSIYSQYNFLINLIGISIDKIKSYKI